MDAAPKVLERGLSDVTTYRIIGPSFVANIQVDEDGIIVAADTLLDWAIGRDWTWIRTYCDRKAWNIQPKMEALGHVAEVELDEETYEFHWIGNRCVRITRHSEGEKPEDVTFSDLPDEIKELIE